MHYEQRLSEGRRAARPAVFAVAAFAVTCVAFYLAQIVGVLTFGPYQPSSIGLKLIFLISQLLVAVPVTLYLARQQPLPSAEIFRLRRVGPGTYAAAVIAMIALGVLLQFLILFTEAVLLPEEMARAFHASRVESSGMYSAFLSWTSPGELAMSLLVVAVGAPLMEELLFRGLIQRSFERSLAPAAAIAITSILFTIIHFQLANAVPIMGIGVMLGFVAWRTASIGPAIAAHAAWNAVMTIVIRQATEFEMHRFTTDDLLRQAPFAAAAMVVLLLSMRWIIRRHPSPSSSLASTEL